MLRKLILAGVIAIGVIACGQTAEPPQHYDLYAPEATKAPLRLPDAIGVWDNAACGWQNTYALPSDFAAWSDTECVYQILPVTYELLAKHEAYGCRVTSGAVAKDLPHGARVTFAEGDAPIRTGCVLRAITEW